MPLPASLQRPRIAAAVILVAFLGAHAVLADDNGAWRGFAPAPGRSEHAAVYDAANDRLVVVLGQYHEEELSPLERDVWTRSFTPFGGWQEMLPTGSGPALLGSANALMIYDSSRNRFVMALGSQLTILDLSRGGAWTTEAIAGTPPESIAAPVAAVYDAGADRIIYVEESSVDTVSNEVWSVNLSGAPTWVQISPSGTPPPGRFLASAVYDAAAARMIVFGGELNTSGGLQEVLRDVWALSLGASPAWIEITPSVPGPDGRTDAAVMIDPVRNRMLLQGGSISLNGSVVDTTLWALDLGSTPAWSVVTTTGPGPPRLQNHTMSYDALRDRILVYGGKLLGEAQQELVPSYPSSDVRALDLASAVWTILPNTKPAPRHGHTAIYDAPRQRMIMFGGASYEGEGFGETWALSLGAGQEWANLAPPGSPPAASGHTAVFDPIRQRMLVFGGNPTSNVWSLDLAGPSGWTVLSTSGTPPGSRYWHVAIYDPNGDRMIVYGGEGFTDVWQLTLSGTPTWTQLNPTGTAPPALFRPSAIYDPVGARMLVVGSGTQRGSPASLWSLSLTGSPAWRLLTTTGTGPNDCGGYAAAYDDSRQRMLMFSGGAGCNSNSTSTYALSLGGSLVWTPLTPVNARPVTRCGPSAIYDSAGDRMVIYGGEWCNGFGDNVDMDSAWSLAFGSTVSAPLPALPADVTLFPATPNPASGDVTLAFALPHEATARLVIYDLAGRKCAELFSGEVTAGRHEVRWSRSAREASRLGAGVYFCELKVGNRRAARRVVVTR